MHESVLKALKCGAYTIADINPLVYEVIEIGHKNYKDWS